MPRRVTAAVRLAAYGARRLCPSTMTLKNASANSPAATASTIARIDRLSSVDSACQRVSGTATPTAVTGSLRDKGPLVGR